MPWALSWRALVTGESPVLKTLPVPWSLLRTPGPPREFGGRPISRKNIRAIFTEVSFPNELAPLAQKSYHHTPRSLELELSKMPQGVKVFLGHLKPAYQKKLLQQIGQVHQERERQGYRQAIQILGSDSGPFEF